MIDAPTEFQRQVDELDDTWTVAQHIVLPHDATVMVLGAYRGKLITYLLQRHPHIGMVYGFEPQSWAVMEAMAHIRIALDWEQSNKVRLFDYGLVVDSETQIVTMGEWATDGCSIVSQSRDRGVGTFEPFDKVVQRIVHGEARNTIDLLVMNIEGYEWKLLNAMQFDGIDGSCVQFHEHALQSSELAQSTRAAMSVQYGKPVLDDYPSWVYWKRS